MPASTWFPPIDVICRSCGISKERLDARGQVAVSLDLLVLLLREALKGSAFDEQFYLDAYDDVASAYRQGMIQDLRAHYLNIGYFEGKLGSEPDVDETFYRKAYSDVDAAISSGRMASAREHYIRHGAREGRVPNRQADEELARWHLAMRGIE